MGKPVSSACRWQGLRQTVDTGRRAVEALDIRMNDNTIRTKDTMVPLSAALGQAIDRLADAYEAETERWLREMRRNKRDSRLRD